METDSRPRTEADIAREAKIRRKTDAFERKKAAAAERSAAMAIEDAARLQQALRQTDDQLPDVGNLAINADGAPTPAISVQGGVDEQLTMAELYEKYANDDASRAAPIKAVDATISGEGVVETVKQAAARRSREYRAKLKAKKTAAAIMQGADVTSEEPMQTDDPIETPQQKRNRRARDEYARKRDEQTPEARKASKDRRNAAAKADRAARTAEENAAANAARQAKVTAEQRASHAAAELAAIETRPRTAEQIDAHRAANRVANMTEERQEAHRAANRVVNMTPQAIVMQNDRAARRRELLHPDFE